MKVLKSLILWLAVAIIAIVLTAHVVLALGFVGIVERFVLPKAESALGADIELSDGSFNLLGADVSLSGVRISNPKTFDEGTFVSLPECRVESSIWPLLRGRFAIHRARVKDAVITITRNRKGKVNVLELPQAQRQASSGESRKAPRSEKAEESRPSETGTETPMPLPHLAIDNASLNATLEYTDYQITENGIHVPLSLELKMDGIRTYGSAEERGTVRLTGYLVNHPETAVTDIEIHIAPVTDPERPTFDLQGGVSSIPLKELEAYTSDIGLRGERADFAADLVCREGKYEEGSHIVLTIYNPSLSGDLARKAGKLRLPSKFSFPVPIGGPFQKPRIPNIENLIIHAVLQNFSQGASGLLKQAVGDDKNTGDVVKKVFEGLGEDGKSIQRSVGDALKKLGVGD